MNKILVLLGVFITFISYGQVPTLSGTINVSIKKGTIDCDFTLTDIPRIEDYEILINSGLNLNVIRSDEKNYNYGYEKNYNKNISEESFLYSINNKEGKHLPQTLRFIYSGKFPVKSDTTFMRKSGDSKGNIAFNGESLRMDGYQTNWYPVLYDIKKEKRYDIIKYDINVVCNDCKTLYVNGNNPVYSKEQNFKKDTPTEIFIFIGNYDFFNINDIYFINPDINEQEMRDFAEINKSFQNYYEKKIGIPYNGFFNYLQTTPTFNRKSGFLFVSYPTIANVGKGNYGLKFFVNKKNPYARPLIAHELAHYYFGSGFKRFNTEIGKIIQEGFSEYMSYKISKDILGKDVYKNKLENSLSRLKEKEFLPVSRIKLKDDFGKNYYSYVYNYFPAILLTIEKEIGEKKMWKWINTLLTTKAELTNYDFLEQTLIKTLDNQKKSNKIIKKYFKSRPDRI
ncbi:MAG TPA: hypothetical protein EYP87_04285 [Flavobacteriaceae bacterium]|nr:hypothetical protein [Flavobacteriaceae bacterium]